MSNEVNTMQGSGLKRRTLLKALPLMALTNRAFAAAEPGLRLQKINCFELRVSDVERSVKFYQQLFGMSVQSRNGGRVCLRVGAGPAFMAIRKVEAGEMPGITHIGYSVENFEQTRVQKALEQSGYASVQAPALGSPGLANAMKQWIRMRGDTPELYFTDQSGLLLQLSDKSYCGGTGKLGAVCDKPEPVAPGLFKLTDISHFTVFLGDGAAANTYYQNLFGLKVQAYQGPGAPVTGIGDGKQFVMYAGGGPAPGGAPPAAAGGAAPAAGPRPPTAARIDHGCFLMEGFKVDDVLAKLTSAGLSARPDRTPTGPLMHYISLRQPNRGGAEGGTPELYFSDPDGILMQLQDPSYCGGGGYLGNECLKA